MHIHARSKAVQSAVAQSTVQPRPAFANSDLEQHARKASLSALAAPKQARTASLSTLTTPEHARPAILIALAAPKQARSAFPSALAAPGQARAAILSAPAALKQARTAPSSALAAPEQAGAGHFERQVAPVQHLHVFLHVFEPQQRNALNGRMRPRALRTRTRTFV